MATTHDDEAHYRLPALSELREYRLRNRVRLQDVSTYSGLSLTRLSRIERAPDLAKEEELRAHRAAVDRAARELYRGAA